MKQIVTSGIVLTRTNFGEADRIVTLLTDNNGKLRLMARGVRRQKSKLAGGIELFCVSDITFIPGRGEIGTLISSRLRNHYGRIVENIDRVQLGYELIKLINKSTEDEPESAYFDLMSRSFVALNDSTVNADLIRCWFQAQLLKQAGHMPNLLTDTDDNKLLANQSYNFDFDNMTFTLHPDGHTNTQQIKTLRLLFDGHAPAKLQQVSGLQATLSDITPLINTMLTSYIRV